MPLLLPFKLRYTRHHPRHWDSRKNQRMSTLLKLTLWWDSQEMGLKIFEKLPVYEYYYIITTPPHKLQLLCWLEHS